MKYKGTGQILSPITILVITVLIDMTGFGMIIPLIPFYAQKLDAGPSGIGILLTSFSVMQFFFSPLLARARIEPDLRLIFLVQARACIFFVNFFILPKIPFIEAFF